MTIRIYPTNWDRYCHAQGGASDSVVAVSCDSDLEILAVEWLFPGIGDCGPVQ